MLVLPSALLGDAKGSLGSTTFKTSRSGICVQNKRKSSPTARFSITSSTLHIASVARTWRNMSAAQRDSWSSAAHSVPHYDRFGKTISLSGWNLFSQRNILLFCIGQSSTVDPYAPPLFSPNVIVPGTFSISTSSISFLVLPFSPDFGFTLYLSRPSSPGITHHNVSVHQILSFVGDNIGGVQDITSSYQSVYSNSWLQCLGFSIFLKLLIYHLPSGKILQSIYTSVPITA